MHSVGDEVWYAITVTNNSDFAEENAVVKDTLVNGLTYVEAKINNVNTDARREVSVNGQEITWTTDLAKGETKTLYVKVRINQNAISEENFVSSEVTGSVTDWWKTDNSHREIGAQQKTAQLFIRLDGEILEGDENEGHDTDLYTDCVGTVELTDKNWNGDYAYTTEQNAIKVGADSTPTTVEGYSRLNYNIFQFVVGGTDLDTIAQRINNFVGDNGERVHFDPETQMIVCYVLKYEDDGYHIDAVIRDRVQTKVDLYKVGNEAVVNGNRDNVDININDITEITQYKVQKQWVDNGRENERPTSVDVQLYANNVFKDTVSLTAENNWTYTWEELNKKDSNGNNITYTVKEAVINNETAKVFENNEINGNYIVTYENAEGKTTITNTYSEPNIAVEKSRVGDNTAVKYGEEITYNITATNTGTASGKVTIKDELATNMEPRGNVTVETKQLDGRTIATSEMSFDELIKGKEFEVANGTKVVLTFTVTANGYAGEDVNNTADYKKDGEDEFTPTETVKTDLEDTADVVTTTTTEKGQKVILVLDLSGSMKDKIKVGSGWNTKYETKLSLMKSAVSTFLNDFLKNEKNEVMIITYSSSAEMKCDYTNSVQKAYNSIGNWANGGTNIDGGLTLANSKISKEDVENTSVILMTDGIPGYYVDEWGISHSVWAGGNYYDKTAGEETVKAGNTLTNRGVNVYTIGFGVDDKDALDMLKRTASDEKYYYSTFDGDALTEAFESISSTITINYDPVPMSTQDGKITLRSGFEVGQNVEVYYKENYDKENVEDSTPYEIISWNNFINSDYVEYNASEGTLTFDLGAYMKAKGMDKDEELTIRFVRAQTAQTRLSSANVVSFMVDSIADDTINNETVSTYEEKFNEAETNKEETTPVVEEEKTENVETTTPNEETEVVEDDKENETEGTEAGAIESENTTTEEKPAEEPAETETTEGTESVEQETSNINEQKAE